MPLNMLIICQTARLYVSIVDLFEKYILGELFSTYTTALCMMGLPLLHASLPCLKLQTVSFTYNEVIFLPLQAANDRIIHTHLHLLCA